LRAFYIHVNPCFRINASRIRELVPRSYGEVDVYFIECLEPLRLTGEEAKVLILEYGEYRRKPEDLPQTVV